MPSEATRLSDLLERQREACRLDPVPAEASRRHDLRALRAFLKDHQTGIVEAISKDYGHRSHHETRLTEILPVVRDIDRTLTELRSWMRTQSRWTDRLAFGLASNRVRPQPLGVVGVIVPWNFPINLSFLPLVSIFAAGNRAMVKLSEHSPHLTELLTRRIPDYFAAEKLVFLADPGNLGEAFSALPFDHLLFTGSTQTGRKVMRAAADHLCPVTLELGGRSPALVCDDFEIPVAARRILYAKCLNAGQICTTVDHAYVPAARLDAFVDHARQVVHKRYGSLASPDYTSIIHAAAYRRLTEALDEVQDRGGRVIALLPPPARDESAHRLAPHLVLDAPADCALLQGEIFGPILPVLAYESLEHVVSELKSRPRSLAFYPFTHDRARLQWLLDQVMSGGVSVNDALFHVAQSDLPFGGVGASGMGQYHGRAGFENFSKLRPVFHQSRWSVSALIAPPYGKWVEAVLRRLGA